MTVKELLEFLKEQPEEAKVIVIGYKENTYINEDVTDMYFSWSDKVVLKIFKEGK